LAIRNSNVPPEHQTQPCVLLVDDDELVLSALRVVLELNAGVRVVGFTDPLQAIEELERTPVDIVISDYLMPGMNGIDLLRKALQCQPDSVRILLTGFADKQNAIRAINEVGIYQYLEKPWDNDQLLMVVHSALERKSLRHELTEKVRTLDRLLSDHHELTLRHSRLERELEMAARVQRSLLPSCFPESAGFQISSLYHPCDAIGGDYYDFLKRDGRTVLLVSDVTGHGVQAALSSMLLKATFQQTGLCADDPATLFAELNGKLARVLPGEVYAAASILWLDEGSSTVRLANAGLPYPFVLRCSPPRLDEIPVAGIPLGMFDQVGIDSYDVREIEMMPGDVLLVTSDGLAETQQENGELFGDQQLRLALNDFGGRNGREVISGLMERVRLFTGRKPPQDDLTMVAVTRL
jgi:phosphoserine phosphatase RsbU/P